jgi:hypothetical protein
MGDAIVPLPGKWWRKPFGMLQTNLREIDVDMDVNAVAEYIVDHGADAWLISVGGIQAQYPTMLKFHTQNERVAARKSGDLISDALEAAHSRGLRLLARMDFSKVSARVAAEHPDYCFMSPTGELQTHTGELVSVCPSGPYYQQRLFEILDEVTTRYSFDGFFINWMWMNEEDYYKKYHGVCHCGSCQSGWLKYSGGLELPKGPQDPTYTKWLSFARDVVDEITARIRAFLAQRLPDACLILGKTSDVMFHEANNAVGRELWHHATSEWVSTWKSYRPDLPVLVNSTTFMDMPYRMASEEPAHFAQYFLQCISRGGNPSTYMMGIPGRIPYLCMDTGREIHNFHKRWRPVYDGLQPSAKIALVRPDRPLMSAQQYTEALSEFRGLYSGMQELHIFFDVIAQEHLEAVGENGSLQRYQVVILPNLGKLGQKEVDYVDDWVSVGGRLFATGSSGVGAGGDVQFKSLPALRERAVISKRELLFSSYIAPPQTSSSQHQYNGPIISLYGAYHLFEWKKDTRGRYKMLARAAFAPPELAYGNVEVEQRGCGIGDYGKGKGVVIPMTIGRSYRETGLKCFRDFFEELLREEGGVVEPLSLHTAEQVEATINVNEDKTVVHLINMSGARKQNFGTHLPIHGGIIKLSAPGKFEAHALKRDQKLEVKDGVVTLPTLDLYEVVVIKSIQ